MSAVHDLNYPEAPDAEAPSGETTQSSIYEGALSELGALFRGSETLASIRASAEQPEAAGPAHPVALAGSSGLAETAGPADWTRTLTLVERAAARIKAYEKRFLQLEKQSQALADRANEDQHRLRSHIQALEERLKQAEERIATAEAAARDAEYHEWEAGTQVKRAEQRAAEAETRGLQAEAYLRRVHDLLSGVA